MSRTPVSAVIITFNEEKKIGNCLQALTWADEIVVVDALSTDRTREICSDPAAPWSGKLRLFERAWTGFKDQRNFAIAQAKYDWVFVVDSDEECSPELRARLLEYLSRSGGPELKAYKVHRLEFFFGKQILHGMWNPSYQDRFFDRRGVQYINDVHEYPVFHSTPGEIHEALIHRTDITIERFIDKMNKYSSIEAKDRYEQGQRTNLFKLVTAFPAHFLKTLIYYGGYKDGIHGWIIALLEGASRLVRQVKIWQLMQNDAKKGTL